MLYEKNERTSHLWRTHIVVTLRSMFLSQPRMEHPLIISLYNRYRSRENGKFSLLVTAFILHSTCLKGNKPCTVPKRNGLRELFSNQRSSNDLRETRGTWRKWKKNLTDLQVYERADILKISRWLYSRDSGNVNLSLFKFNLAWCLLLNFCFVWFKPQHIYYIWLGLGAQLSSNP